MKILLLFICSTILIPLDNFGQAIPAEIGNIKVEVITFYFKRNKHFELTKKTRKNGLSRYYFDSNLNLIEEIHYGKHHNNNLKLLDRVEQYFYSSTGQLTQSREWETDYDKTISPSYYTEYSYDINNRLTNQTTYDEKDSVFMTIQIEYMENKSITRIGKSQTIIREYDSTDRIITKKQLWDNDTKTNWIINYSYDGNCITENFDSYYDDSVRDYSKKKIDYYANDRLFERIEYYVDKDGLNEKTTFIYRQNGLLKKIEMRSHSSIDKEFQLVGFIQIKVSGQNSFDVKTAKIINEQLIDLVIR